MILTILNAFKVILGFSFFFEFGDLGRSSRTTVVIDVNSKCGEWAQSGGGRGFAPVVTPTVTTPHTRSYFKLFNSEFIFTPDMFILTFLCAS